MMEEPKKTEQPEEDFGDFDEPEPEPEPKPVAKKPVKKVVKKVVKKKAEPEPKPEETNDLDFMMNTEEPATTSAPAAADPFDFFTF